MPRAVIDAAVLTAARCNAAVPAVAVKDTVKTFDGEFITSTPDRETLRAVQTPQVFRAAQTTPRIWAAVRHLRGRST